MSYVQMRSFPGLFVGRRAVMRAVAVEDERQTAYRCGTCSGLMAAPAGVVDLAHVVLRCDCGELNQL